MGEANGADRAGRIVAPDLRERVFGRRVKGKGLPKSGRFDEPEASVIGGIAQNHGARPAVVPTFCQKRLDELRTDALSTVRKRHAHGG